MTETMTTNDVSDTRISAERLANALAELTDCFLEKHGCFPIDNKRWNAAMTEAYALVGQPGTHTRTDKLSTFTARTQSPAEWQVEGPVVGWGLRKKGQPVFIPYLNKPDAGPEYEVVPLGILRAASIPAPERSKEETSFGVDAAEDEVRKLLHPKKEPDENGFIIGEPVEKFTGEARWEGVLVASYLTTKGQRRYVVEVKPQGFQMIAVPAQLRMIATLESS